MNILALIPARAGSKGVPCKNKMYIGGKRLIEYTMDAVLNAQSVLCVAVTSDDSEILEIARHREIYAIDRPVALATDKIPMIPVIVHALECAEQMFSVTFDGILLLQPTSPLRTADDIDKAIRLFVDGSGRSVCSVYKVDDAHPARMYTIQKDAMQPIMEGIDSSLRQQLPDVYHRNGAIYLFQPLRLHEGDLLGTRCIPYIMPLERSVNIDNWNDVLLFDAMIKHEKK